MAYRIVVMPSAYDDLEEHTAYIYRDSKRHAREWLTGAWKTIFSLAENPRRFAVIPEADEIGEELRDVLHCSHRIVFG